MCMWKIMKKQNNIPSEKNRKQGFIMNLVLLIVVVFALSYIFGFDLVGFLKQPETRDFFTGIYNGIKTFITNFINDPFRDLLDALHEMRE